MHSRILKLVCVLALSILVGCKVELNANLNEEDANEALAVLISNGIIASKDKGLEDKYRLLVEQRQFSEAFETLKANGLPRQKRTNSGELFASDGIIASPTQEWVKYSFAKSQELSYSIGGMKGVVSADVHIARPREKTPFESAIKPSASVLVRVHEDRASDDLVPKIKNLVSLGIQDLEYERVGVVVTTTRPVKHQTDLTTFLGVTIREENKRDIQRLAMVGGTLFVVLLFLGSVFVVRFMRHRVLKKVTK
ncbi:type III secretion system inner membrane ring lipoprotein SctJ [uncultured Tateyamaria sp.]|uniref:type III secretion system inner membrane ring lipoprotein SctJ n=1 Tax=uncultured Tateyamaria sp. TaxID=455651 RepID=UPI002601D121|nr:type III secretion inner membrane ring lipoprotein SctJ [uncultured Tateyamaria sp.]